MEVCGMCDKYRSAYKWCVKHRICVYPTKDQCDKFELIKGSPDVLTIDCSKQGCNGRIVSNRGFIQLCKVCNTSYHFSSGKPKKRYKV